MLKIREDLIDIQSNLYRLRTEDNAMLICEKCNIKIQAADCLYF